MPSTLRVRNGDEDRFDGGDTSGIQRFLDEFAAALTAGDGRAVARLWGVPALVLGNESVMSVGTIGEVERFFSGAKEEYNRRGIVDTRADILDLRWLTDQIALVQVRWPYLDAEGTTRGEETSTYLLRRDAEGKLELRVAVMQGAS